ncbi:DNA-binding CsgD family transcriptional regulator/GAF domain-containing protein [Mycolicibacterium sp. BK556]|uniref:LuxR C-terminal-related transcriptional regulator n=1 Tax=unclassified Mycolicibacterium TaxID=2636767 RepID=UPI001612D514|nr:MULTISPECIES: LuxR C-terminal-related transcriptional regulator [unclassified Mycolicibacterium]MBB3605976.1 DNA-binding CsgD family transcriptional regulator/GAF domain-containing protein [Mycolicibacterium sp. BK556]MBB3632553.1 DNA-binding CsgD family transcriptional regulator/GAF domain-containing protein [Mycolicibacterium sp. BK607]
MRQEAAWPSPDPSDCIEQAWDIVRATAEITGVSGLGPSEPRSGAAAADASLTAARRALADHLEITESLPTVCDRVSVSALALRADHAQVAIKDVLLAQQRGQVERAEHAITGLRAATSIAGLVELIPTEVYRMGFARVLFSRIRNGLWLTCSAFAADDQEMASKMVAAGLAHPRQLMAPLIESEMVRRGSPILVTDPRDDSRVHPELLAVTQTPAYVAAPVFSWGRPVGLLHADRPRGAAELTEFDRDALGLFAASLGLAFERNLMLDRLRAMRRAAEDHMRLAGALADDFLVDVIESAGPAPYSHPALVELDHPAGRGSDGRDTNPLRSLTSREAEVLGAIAAGRTNAQVAASLFVTEGTVKSHVKQILRKLGAANRTEAVAKYHRAQRTIL